MKRSSVLPGIFIAGLWILVSLSGTQEVMASQKTEVDIEPGAACIRCHEKESPGIVAEWKKSGHNQKKTVDCFDCHSEYEGDKGAYEHYGEFITTIVTPKT